jgi:hypothetical protein
MATIETDRRIGAFVMHGHVHEQHLDNYADLFQFKESA